MNSASLPYDNLEEIGVLLQAVFSGNNETTLHSQEVFAKMAENPVRFIDSLMKVVLSEKEGIFYLLLISHYSPAIDAQILKVKKAAVTVISRSLSHIFDIKNLKNEKYPVDQRNYILETVVLAMYSNKVNPTLKAQLQHFISVILHTDVENHYKQRVLGLAKEKLATGQLNDYAASYLLIKSVVEEPSNKQKVLAEWFKLLLEDLLISGNIIIDGVGSEIEAILKGAVEQEKFANIFVG